jgi:SAM-dependent methyltransferase
VNRDIRSVEDLLRMLDGLFVDQPDETLDAWLRDGPLGEGRALELGCGPGRNARRLAEAGYEVDAVDRSPAAGTGDPGSGTEVPDAQLYRDRSLHGGLAYTPDELRRLFDGYTEVELRPMRAATGLFGVPFLLAGLFRKD